MSVFLKPVSLASDLQNYFCSGIAIIYPLPLLRSLTAGFIIYFLKVMTLADCVYVCVRGCVCECTCVCFILDETGRLEETEV